MSSFACQACSSPRVQGHQNEQHWLEKQVEIMLWNLAMPDCYWSVGKQFRIGKSTVEAIVIKVCKAIKHIMLHRVCDSQQYAGIVDGFPAIRFLKWGGATEGMHISTLTPLPLASEYINRRGFFSMIMQVLVDHPRHFIYISVGWPWKVHDTCIFKNTGLFQSCKYGQSSLTGMFPMAMLKCLWCFWGTQPTPCSQAKEWSTTS